MSNSVLTPREMLVSEDDPKAAGSEAARANAYQRITNILVFGVGSCLLVAYLLLR